jgi:hypothetical protein
MTATAILKTFLPGILAATALIGGIHWLHSSLLTSAPITETSKQTQQAGQAQEYAKVMKIMQTGRVDQ